MIICTYCSTPSTCACYWPVKRFEVDEAENLVTGDVVHRLIERREPKSTATVESITVAGQIMKITLLITAPGKTDRRKVIEANSFSRIRVLRVVPCGAAACEACSRELGDTKHVCKAHWSEMECAE